MSLSASANASPQTTPRLMLDSPRGSRRKGSSRRASRRKQSENAVQIIVGNMHRAALSRDVSLLERELDADGAQHIDAVEEGSGDTTLMTCIRVGAFECLMLLLKKGAAVTCRTPDGQSCLHLAASGGHTRILGKLLSVVGDGVVNAVDAARGTALFYAAQGNHLDCVREILASLEPLQLDTVHQYGGSALCAAARVGSVECCRLLIDAKASLETERSRDGATPLMIACVSNKWDCVQHLLDAGANVNVKLHGKTLSQASIKYGDGSVAKKLQLQPPKRRSRAASAPISPISHIISTAAEEATEKQPIDLWHSSIEHMVLNQPGNGPTPTLLTFLLQQTENLGGMKSEGLFRLSVGEDQVSACKEHLASVGYGEWTELVDDNPHVPAVVLKRWLRELPVPLLDDYNAVIEAVEENRVQSYALVIDSLCRSHRAVLQQLIEFLVRLLPMQKYTKMTEENFAIVFSPSVMRNPSKDPLCLLGNQPKEQKFVMNLILWYEDLFEVGEKVQVKIEPDVFQVIGASDSLREAVVAGDVQAVRSALRAGADIETKTHEKGDSVLISAARHKYYDVLRCLVDNGANVEMRNSVGATAICVGAFVGDPSVVNILIDAKADVNARDLQDACPLYGCVVTNANALVVEALLNARADVDATRKQLSCLMLAAKNNHHQVAQLLLQFGANVNLLSKSGRTAAQISLRSGDGVVAQYIEAHKEKASSGGGAERPPVLALNEEKLGLWRKMLGDGLIDEQEFQLKRKQLEESMKRQFHVGECVLARRVQDGMWYHAEISKVHADSYDVVFAEFGNVQMTKSFDIADDPDDAPSPPKTTKSSSAGKLQDLHSMNSNDETVRIMLKKGTSTSPRSNECKECRKILGPSSVAHRCSECRKQFCLECLHKVLLSSFGEKKKRSICKVCLVDVKAKVDAESGGTVSIVKPPATPPPKQPKVTQVLSASPIRDNDAAANGGEHDFAKFGTMGSNHLSKRLQMTPIPAAATPPVGRRKMPPGHQPPNPRNAGEPPSAAEIRKFSIAQVVIYFREMGATEEHLRVLKKEMIDGDSLLEFTSADLKTELGLPFGLIKKHMRNVKK